MEDFYRYRLAICDACPEVDFPHPPLAEQGADLETRTFMIPRDFLASEKKDSKQMTAIELGRNLTFNRPFWVFLWRDQATYPYFAARIGELFQIATRRI